MHNSLRSQLDSLIEKGKAGQLDKSRLHITQPAVCNSAAGHYIGTWCVEYEGGMWYQQPYSRDSGYMTCEQAEKLLLSDYRD